MEEDEPGYSDALGVISALEKTCELEAKIRQAIQSTHPLTTTLDWDFHAADREREALLAISEQLEYLEDKLREYRHMESRELDNKAVVLSQLDNVRRELVQVTQNQQHNVTFGKEVVKEVLNFATLSDGGGAGSVCYDETGSYQSPPLRGVRHPPPYGRGSSGGRGYSSYASPPRRDELSSPPSTLFSPGGTASRSTDPSGAASPYQKLNPLYAQQRRQYLQQLEAERQRQHGLSESEATGAGAGGPYSRGASRNSYSQGGGAGAEHLSGASFSGASSRPPAAPRRQINLDGPGDGRGGGDRAQGSRATGGPSRGSEGWERVTSTSASYPPPAAAPQREVYSFRRSAEGGLPASATGEHAQPQGRGAASSASGGYDSRQLQQRSSGSSGAPPRRAAVDYDDDYEADSSARYRQQQQQQQLDPPAPARSDSRAAGSQKRQPSSAFASRVAGPSASSGSVRSGRDGLGDALGMGPGSRGRSREEERSVSVSGSGSRFLTTQRRRSPSPVSLRPEDIYGAVGGADSGFARPSASATSGEPSAEFGGMVRIRDLLNKAETDLSKVAEERAARRAPHPPRIFGDDLSNRCKEGMEDGGADGGSSSAYSPTHSNRRYPLSVGTAVVGGGHCDRPAPRVIDREASHAPAASVAPCGNGWSGGSSGGGGGGAGGFLGRLLLRLAGMAVAGAAAALGVAAVSSVMHHLGSRKAPSKAQPMRDLPPWLAAPPQPPPGAPQRSPSRSKRPPGSPQAGLHPQQQGRKGDAPPWGQPGAAPAPPLWGGGGSAGAPNGAMPVLVTQSPVTHVQPLPEGDLFPSMPPPDVNVAKG